MNSSCSHGPGRFIFNEEIFLLAEAFQKRDFILSDGVESQVGWDIASREAFCCILEITKINMPNEDFSPSTTIRRSGELELPLLLNRGSASILKPVSWLTKEHFLLPVHHAKVPRRQANFWHKPD